MSAAALAFTISYVCLFGVSKEPHDEGLPVHVFQLLMGGQIPIILYFIFSQLSKKPREMVHILIIQIVVFIIAFAPVYFLEL